MNSNIPSPSINLNPKIEPLPRISRTAPRTVKAKVNPMPIPSPSTMEDKILFLEAKASALPKTIQLTTISGINNPSASNRAGTYACMDSSTMVTKEAMITMKAGILTLSGIKFLIRETTRLLITSTKRVASPIPIPLIALVVVPSVGHKPRKRTNTGFSFINPFVRFFIWLIFHLLSKKFYMHVPQHHKKLWN